MAAVDRTHRVPAAASGRQTRAGSTTYSTASDTTEHRCDVKLQAMKPLRGTSPPGNSRHRVLLVCHAHFACKLTSSRTVRRAMWGPPPLLVAMRTARHYTSSLWAKTSPHEHSSHHLRVYTAGGSTTAFPTPTQQRHYTSSLWAETSPRLARDGGVALHQPTAVVPTPEHSSHHLRVYTAGGSTTPFPTPTQLGLQRHPMGT